MPTPEEIKRGQQQNQDQKLNNDLLRENNDLLKQRLAISQQSLDDQRDFANLLNDQTKDITFQKQERTELLGIGRALNKIAQDSYSLDRDTLGLAKTTNDIRSRQAEIAKRIMQLKS